MYPPADIRMIPAPPIRDIFSPRRKYDIPTRNTGVSVRNGIEKLIGDTLSALTYSMIAAISRGSAIDDETQNILSRDGTSIRRSVITNKGKANNNLIHATRYSSLTAKTFLAIASLVASKKAVSKAYMIHNSSSRLC
jgi:hypothetical protein